MAASETVRLRLQFDYPPPATPHCTVFWLLVDLNRCRVVTDLISLIRQRFGFSSGALLGLYLEGGLLPPAESARLVRDNDCLRCAGARGAGGGAARGRACWTFRSGTPGGELAAERHVRELLSGPARNGASFPGTLLIPGGLDLVQFRCSRAEPVLSQAVCCVRGACATGLHLVSAVGNQKRQEDRNVFLVMYGMSHLSALATCPLLLDVILCLTQVSLGPFELVLGCVSVVNRDTEAECVFQLRDCLPISKT